MKKLLMTGAAIMALSTAAGASTFSLIGGTPGFIPGGASNEILTNVWAQPTANGIFGAQVELDADADIQVDFIGYEAGWINAFTFGGTSTNTEGGPNGLEQGNNGTNNSEWAEIVVNPNPLLVPISSYTVTGVTAGLLNFSFSVNNGADSVANGSNPDNVGMTPNFFVSYGVRDPGTIYLWLDDGGAGNDDNHDDFVVRLTTNSSPPGPTPVPLPAAGLMLMGALGGLGLMKRRK